MNEIISRADALAAGLRHYFTGIPCKRGHQSIRWAKNCICVACSQEDSKAWREAHPERILELEAERRAANPGRSTKYGAAWKARNPDKVKQASKEYREKSGGKTAAATKKWYHANKDKAREARRAYRKANPAQSSAWVSERRAARVNATPPWADKGAILAIYQEAVDKGLSVDHIIPLKHDLVCGLHVAGNLQLLTISENSRKGNKFNPDDFEISPAKIDKSAHWVPDLSMERMRN
jgi:hypothetical protein